MSFGEATSMELMNSLHRLDNFLFTAIFDRANRRSIRILARHLSRSGDGYLCVIVPLFLLLTSFPHALMYSQLLVGAMALERLCYWCLKNSLRRLRPTDADPGIEGVIVAGDKFSFPSGHTSAAFVLVTTLVLVYGPAFQALYLWSALIAVSRVVLGVHYPGDTVAGGLMGMSIAVLVAIAMGI